MTYPCGCNPESSGTTQLSENNFVLTAVAPPLGTKSSDLSLLHVPQIPSTFSPRLDEMYVSRKLALYNVTIPHAAAFTLNTLLAYVTSTLVPL